MISGLKNIILLMGIEIINRYNNGESMIDGKLLWFLLILTEKLKDETTHQGNSKFEIERVNIREKYKDLQQYQTEVEADVVEERDDLKGGLINSLKKAQKQKKTTLDLSQQQSKGSIKSPLSEDRRDSLAQKSTTTSTQSQHSGLNLFEIQGKRFMESLVSLRDLPNEEDHENSYIDDGEAVDEEDDIPFNCNFSLRQDVDSQQCSPLVNSLYEYDLNTNRTAQMRQVSYERLNNCSSEKLDQIMLKIQSQEKLHFELTKAYERRLSRQCSTNLYEIFDIPEKTDSNLQFNAQSTSFITE